VKLIIQIPCYNEEKTIARTLADLPKSVEGITAIETLIIDDGSSDRTIEAARAAGVTHVVRLLNHRGLSTAFVAGINAALRLGADVIVSHAVAHADFPQTEACPAAPGSVSGHASIVNETTDPSLLPVLVGFVSIPPTGGLDHQNLDEVSTGAASGGTALSESAGTVGSDGSDASSFAQAERVCVLGTTVCADVVRSQSNTTAGGGAASSDDSGTVLVGVSIMGGPPLEATPPPNTTITLPGIGFVTLNEQFCDGSATLPGCAGATHSGLTVRAIHVVVTNPNALGVPQGTDIIVAEAHSDATFPR